MELIREATINDAILVEVLLELPVDQRRQCVRGDEAHIMVGVAAGDERWRKTSTYESGSTVGRMFPPRLLAGWGWRGAGDGTAAGMLGWI